MGGGAVYLLLTACRLEIDALAHRMTFTRAQLPHSVDWIQFANLSVGDARVDLRLDRHAHDVGVTMLRRDGETEIVSIR
jgi:hypothetical protein